MDDFPNKPQPQDWLVPPELEEIFRNAEEIGSTGLAILSERDIDGVPIPLILKSAMTFGEQLVTAEETENPSLVADDIVASLAELEERYPATPMWDKWRSMALRIFIDHGHLDDAYRLALTISDAHVLVEAMSDRDNPLPLEVSTKLLADVFIPASPERRLAIIRANRDILLNSNPTESELLDTYTTLINNLSGEPDKDMLSDWIATQKNRIKNADWDTIEELLRDDILYGDMPMALRIYCRLRYDETYAETLSDDFTSKLEAGWLEDVIGYYDTARSGKYPNIVIWHQEMGNIATRLIMQGRVAEALELATAIRNPLFMGGMVAEFLKLGAEDEAVELALRIPTPRISADLLMGLDFSDREGALRRMYDFMTSEDTPPETRIGYLEAVRDRLTDIGQEEGAATYQAIIDSLRDAE